MISHFVPWSRISQNATICRQSENGVANCRHSHTGKLNSVYFGPQMVKKTGPEFWLTQRVAIRLSIATHLVVDVFVCHANVCSAMESFSGCATTHTHTHTRLLLTGPFFQSCSNLGYSRLGWSLKSKHLWIVVPLVIHNFISGAHFRVKILHTLFSILQYFVQFAHCCL